MAVDPFGDKRSSGASGGILASIWHRLGGASPLSRLLRNYPPYLIPFPGSSYKLSAGERRANFDHFLERKEERLKVIGQLLREFGIDVAPALDPGEDPLPFLDRLGEWARGEWFRLPGIKGKTEYSYWIESPRGNDDIALTMLLDVSIVLGESIARRRSDFAWAIDDDPWAKRAQSTTWGRVTIFRPRVKGRYDTATSWDIEDSVISHCNKIAKFRSIPSLVSPGFFRVPMEYISGQHDFKAN